VKSVSKDFSASFTPALKSKKYIGEKEVPTEKKFPEYICIL
jgi:hypothetical protein